MDQLRTCAFHQLQLRRHKLVDHAWRLYRLRNFPSNLRGTTSFGCSNTGSFTAASGKDALPSSPCGHSFRPQ
jgi:hypothetical protein